MTLLSSLASSQSSKSVKSLGLKENFASPWLLLPEESNKLPSNFHHPVSLAFATGVSRNALVTVVKLIVEADQILPFQLEAKVRK